MRKIADEQATIESCRAQMQGEVRQSRRMQSPGMLDVGVVRRHRVRITCLEDAIAAAQRRIDEHEAQLEQERSELAKASVALKAIEQLKERRYNRYMEEANRADRREQDEFAAQMYVRRDIPGQAGDSVACP
jgi:flagellar FliJ protein